MAEHTASRSTAPLWEEFNGTNLGDLIELMAEEMWDRTGGPAHAASIAEAELAYLQAGRDRLTYIRLDDAYRDEATAKGRQCAIFGFHLAITARDESLLAANPGRWFDRTMEVAKIVPLSDDARAMYLALIHRALDACQRLRDQANNAEETTA